MLIEVAAQQGCSRSSEDLVGRVKELLAEWLHGGRNRVKSPARLVGPQHLGGLHAKLREQQDVQVSRSITVGAEQDMRWRRRRACRP